MHVLTSGCQGPAASKHARMMTAVLLLRRLLNSAAGGKLLHPMLTHVASALPSSSVFQMPSMGGVSSV